MISSHRFFTLFFLILIFFMLVTDVVGQDLTKHMQEPLLKHRISLFPTAESDRENSDFERLFKQLAPHLKFQNDGSLFTREEWNSVIDNVKSELSASRVMRLVELPNKQTDNLDKSGNGYKDGIDSEIVLLINHGKKDKNKKIFLRLVEAESGYVLHASEAVGPDISGEVKEALGEIESYVITMPWRCRVTDVSNNKIIINRGHLDGLSEGVEMMGYAINSSIKSDASEPEELMLLKSGKKKGMFRVIEVKRNFSSLVSSSGKDLLKKGDILELPEIRMRERKRESRGSRLWDRIYQK